MNGPIVIQLRNPSPEYSGFAMVSASTVQTWAIHRTAPPCPDDDPLRERWTLTHAPSGWALVWGHSLRRLLDLRADLIAEFGPIQTLADLHVRIPGIADVCRRHNPGVPHVEKTRHSLRYLRGVERDRRKYIAERRQMTAARNAPTITEAKGPNTASGEETAP